MTRAHIVVAAGVIVLSLSCKRKPQESLVKQSTVPIDPVEKVCVKDKDKLPQALTNALKRLVQFRLNEQTPSPLDPKIFSSRLKNFVAGSGDTLFADTIDIQYLIDMGLQSWTGQGNIGEICATAFLTAHFTAQTLLGVPAVPTLYEQVVATDVVSKGQIVEVQTTTQTEFRFPNGQTTIMGPKKESVRYDTKTNVAVATQVPSASVQTMGVPKKPGSSAPSSTWRPERQGVKDFQEALKRWGRLHDTPENLLGEVWDFVPLPGQNDKPVYFLVLRRFLNEHIGLDFATYVKQGTQFELKNITPLPFRLMAAPNENLSQALPEKSVFYPGLWAGQFADNANSMAITGNTLFGVLNIRTDFGAKLNVSRYNEIKEMHINRSKLLVFTTLLPQTP